MLRNILNQDGKVSLCGVCMNAGCIKENQLIESVAPSNMAELADRVEASVKIIAFLIKRSGSICQEEIRHIKTLRDQESKREQKRQVETMEKIVRVVTEPTSEGRAIVYVQTAVLHGHTSRASLVLELSVHSVGHR